MPNITNSLSSSLSKLKVDLPGLPGLDGTKKFFSESLDKAKDLVDKVTPKEIAVPREGVFGELGRRLISGSPLGNFLGNHGSDTNWRPDGVNKSGSRIPGGSSLYSGGGMFHKGAPGAPDTYAFENSPQGVKFAADHGYKSIDLDMLITKDGVPVNTHWSQPMKKDGFYDPLQKLSENTKISDMTLAEVMRLRNKDGQSQINTVSTMIEQLKKNGIAGDFEVKNDPRFATDEVMGSLARQVREAGIQANVKTIDYGDRSYQALSKAQEHGFWVRTATGNDHTARHFGYGSDPN